MTLKRVCVLQHAKTAFVPIAVLLLLSVHEDKTALVLSLLLLVFGKAYACRDRCHRCQHLKITRMVAG